MKSQPKRIDEIDFFRGIAILLMVYFHLIYDLREFYNYPLEYMTGINYYIGKIAALSFITITGISCGFSGSNFKRGLRILGFAYLITIGSYLYSPSNYINFGILHLLGFSVLLYDAFKNLTPLTLFFWGTTTVLLGIVLGRVTVDTNLLFPFGLLSPQYSSLDYYPMFPYFGFFLYGIFIWKGFYCTQKRLLPYDLGNSLISKLGRRSLLIYLIHQPILLALLFLLHS